MYLLVTLNIVTAFDKLIEYDNDGDGRTALWWMEDDDNPVTIPLDIVRFVEKEFWGHPVSPNGPSVCPTHIHNMRNVLNWSLKYWIKSGNWKAVYFPAIMALPVCNWWQLQRLGAVISFFFHIPVMDWGCRADRIAGNMLWFLEHVVPNPVGYSANKMSSLVE